MAEIDQAIDFLIRHDSLKLGSSPWGTYGAEEDVYQVAWERLFPAFSVEEDLWELGDIASMIADLEGTLRYGSAQRVGGEGIESPSAGCGANWDVCAWYQPIHFFGYDWGIFIREDCVRNLIFRMARFARPPASQPSALVARSLLRAAVYAYFFARALSSQGRVSRLSTTRSHRNIGLPAVPDRSLSEYQWH
ncbi:MAG: hypothetical protein A49_09140 [Methyloceanibacter sp.]|nr:MAG: hypothetical protein A49_09140 [Methyloceanibacter sp.]